MDEREFIAALRKRQSEAQESASDSAMLVVTLDRVTDHLRSIIGHGQQLAAVCPERLRGYAVEFIQKAMDMVLTGDHQGLSDLREWLANGLPSPEEWPTKDD